MMLLHVTVVLCHDWSTHPQTFPLESYINVTDWLLVLLVRRSFDLAALLFTSGCTCSILSNPIYKIIEINSIPIKFPLELSCQKFYMHIYLNGLHFTFLFREIIHIYQIHALRLYYKMATAKPKLFYLQFSLPLVAEPILHLKPNTR